MPLLDAARSGLRGETGATTAARYVKADALLCSTDQCEAKHGRPEYLSDGIQYMRCFRMHL